MADLSILNHALVPFRRRAVFLRLVTSRARAADYAAGGFHVSVARGLAGGCSDPAHDFLDGGTRDGTCLVPLNREDVKAAWATAAALYLEAFSMSATAEVKATVAKLHAANLAADAAYRLEGVTPPADPVVLAPSTAPGVPKPSESIGRLRSGNWALAVASALAFAGVGLTAWATMEPAPRGPHGTQIIRR